MNLKYSASVSAVKFCLFLALFYILSNATSQILFVIFFDRHLNTEEISVFSWTAAFLSVCISVLYFNNWNLAASLGYAAINPLPLRPYIYGFLITVPYVILSSWKGNLSFDIFSGKTPGLFQGQYGFLFLLLLLLIVPIYEEIIFRGVFLDFLRRKINDYISILIISIIFTIIHPQHFGIMSVNVFFFSLILCYFRLRYNSITPCMLMHALYNFISFCFVGRVA